MNEYIMKTRTTMKDYNCKKWWIDHNYIRDVKVSAANPAEAIKAYAEIVNKEHFDIISKNALKNKVPMYSETPDGEDKQIGYVLTAKTLFDKGDYSGYSEQYIDLWVEILQISRPVF